MTQSAAVEALAAKRKERDITPEIMRLLKAHGCRLVQRHNVGAVKAEAKGRTRWIRFGQKGQADVLAAWCGGRVQCRAVGCSVMDYRMLRRLSDCARADQHLIPRGVWLSIEVKRVGARDARQHVIDQLAWRQQVWMAGGIAVEVTSCEQLSALLAWT